jgi:cytochrome P450
MKRKNARKSIAPSFSYSNLKYTFDIIFKSLQVMERKLLRCVNEDIPFELCEEMIKLTFDVITESSFNVYFNTLSDEGEAISNSKKAEGLSFLHNSEIKLRIAFKRTLNPLRKYMFWLSENNEHDVASSNIVNILKGVVAEYNQNHPTKESVMNDTSIMGHIMRHNYDTENERITDLNTFMIAGHETTSHTLTMLFICLCQHPECKKSLQAELDNAIPSHARHDPTQYPSLSQLRSLPYLSHCIDEAMRLYPVVAVGSKRIASCDIEYHGITIPKGSMCTLLYYSMFRQSWITDPDKFIPERWADSSPQSKELRAMLMPFALGSRSCIGQNLAKIEIVMIASYLMRFFDFELISQPDYQIFLSMKALNVMMKVSSRS